MLSPDLSARLGPDPRPHGRAQHVAQAQEFCTQHPTATVGKYLAAFSDGTWTCTVAPVAGLGVDTVIAVACRWEGGLLVEQYELAAAATASAR